MQHILISIPLFCSPTSAFGTASGPFETDQSPEAHGTFSWPTAWVAAKPTYFSPEQSLIMSVSKVGDKVLVMLYGIVFNSIAEARDCVAFLEQQADLFFDEYE